MNWCGAQIVRWRIQGLKEQRELCGISSREFANAAGWGRNYQLWLEARGLSVSPEVKEWITEVFVDRFGKEVGSIFPRQKIRWEINGKELKVAREKCGYSVASFIKFIGWSYNRQRRLESGVVKTITDESKLRIENVLNKTKTYVVDYSRDKTHIGSDIAHWRNYCGLTQKEFAEQAGWDEEFQRRLETGAIFLYKTKARLITVFQTLGCTWDNLTNYIVPKNWKNRKEKGKIIASRRQACGFTITQFAEELGWDKIRLQDIESGCGKKATQEERECINNLLEEYENVKV